MGPANLNHSNLAQGFILLEVLVAMSLIMGAWMVSIGAYQVLALRLTQQESRRSQLRQTFDQYELLEQVRANQNQISLLNNSTKGSKHESSRVSRRNRTVQSVVKPTVKNER
jgi:Tfp pilus assembly protein PilV